MHLEPIPLPVHKPGVLLGGMPTVTLSKSEAMFRLAVNVENQVRNLLFIFSNIYAFRYLEEDHIDVPEFIYGVAEVKSSDWIKELAEAWSIRYSSTPSRAFGNEPEKVRHYRIVFLEHGMYELICKGLRMDLVPPEAPSLP
jgi:hypothetical protein